jgi:uncharacterized protein (TIGR02217 family)
MAVPGSFVEARLPVDISWGAIGGPRWRTTIIQSGGGWEQRNIDWEDAKYVFDVSWGVRNDEQMQLLIDFFNGCRGRAIGFRFKDWTDFEADDELFGIGDASEDTFTLRKTYTLLGESWERDIKKPSLEGEISITLNGAPQTETTHYALDRTTGIVVFVTPPPATQEVRWTGEFDIPMRFEDDHMQISQDWEDVNAWSCKVEEVKL